MKIHIQKQPQEQGSALIVTLTLGVILLVTLASYVSLLSSQKSIVTRSQTWNAAMTMAEAGIEEGLAQVNSSTNIFNFSYATNSNTSTNMDFSNNSWGTGNGGYGPKTGTLLGGSYNAFIKTNEATTPNIYSTGYATVPITGGSVHRIVKITTSTEALLNVGMGAIGNIDFNGNGVISDSYNSQNPNHSTNGQYKASMNESNGSIASEDGFIDLGNHTVDGNEYLGPTASTSTNSGTVTGKIYTDYNVQFPDVTLPAGASGWTTAGASSRWTNYQGVVSTTPTYNFTTSGDYILNSDAYDVVIEPGVTVNLNVTSSTFNYGGSGNDKSISFLGGVGAVGTARFYLSTPTSATISGNAAVPSGTITPENLWFFGLPSLTSITYGGNSDFTGVVYAPEATLTLNGGGNGNNTVNISGAVITKSITDNGNYNIHYDEALATVGPNRGYVATSWQELISPNQ
jgi:hypothetical protein